MAHIRIILEPLLQSMRYVLRFALELIRRTRDSCPRRRAEVDARRAVIAKVRVGYADKFAIPIGSRDPRHAVIQCQQRRRFAGPHLIPRFVQHLDSPFRHTLKAEQLRILLTYTDKSEVWT